MKSRYLDQILSNKRAEVKSLVQFVSEHVQHPLHTILKKSAHLSKLFSSALKSSEMTIIAEIKRHSPSKGEIKTITNPEDLALKYCLGGASAISVLTDKKYFGGCLQDLEDVSKLLLQRYPHTPILRKDFIIHPIQIAEAALAGASAVLLIAGVLGDHLSYFIKETSKLGMEALVEIHQQEEIHLAIEAGAEIIGINHRNLKSFEIDLTLSEKLRPMIPHHIVAVAESGIQTQDDISRMRELQFDAILVGEALVLSSNPIELLKKMRGKK